MVPRNRFASIAWSPYRLEATLLESNQSASTFAIQGISSRVESAVQLFLELQKKLESCRPHRRRRHLSPVAVEHALAAGLDQRHLMIFMSISEGCKAGWISRSPESTLITCGPVIVVPIDQPQRLRQWKTQRMQRSENMFLKHLSLEA